MGELPGRTRTRFRKGIVAAGIPPSLSSSVSRLVCAATGTRQRRCCLSFTGILCWIPPLKARGFVGAQGRHAPTRSGVDQGVEADEFEKRVAQDRFQSRSDDSIPDLHQVREGRCRHARTYAAIGVSSISFHSVLSVRRNEAVSGCRSPQ
jgi:hypothetical protein